jgi:hypothetical protein
VTADHRHASHRHGGGAERADQAAEVGHEEQLLAQAEATLGEVAAIPVELRRVRLVLELQVDGEIGGEGTGHEQLDFVGRLELALGLPWRLRVLEEPADDSHR